MCFRPRMPRTAAASSRPSANSGSRSTTRARDIIAGKDFIQLTDGPFDLNIVFTPDGVDDYAAAKRRAVTEGILPVATIRDIIASKKSSNGKKSGTGAGCRGPARVADFLDANLCSRVDPFHAVGHHRERE